MYNAAFTRVKFTWKCSSKSQQGVQKDRCAGQGVKFVKNQKKKVIMQKVLEILE